MSTKIIALIIGAFVVVGGIAYIAKKGGTAPTNITPQAETVTEATPSAGAPSAGKGSFATLLGMGSVKCDVKTSVGVASQGIVYVAGGKMRSDFSVNTPAGTFHSSMINDGTYVYTWTDAVPQGMKLPAPDVTKQTTAPSPKQPGFDFSSQVDYTCSPWVADASLFVPPTNVNFVAPPTGR